MFIEIIDDSGNPVTVNLDGVLAVTAYANAKKRKDDNPISETYGQEIAGDTRYYIKYELGPNFFKLQSFSNEQNRDEALKRVNRILLNRARRNEKV